MLKLTMIQVQGVFMGKNCWGLKILTVLEVSKGKIIVNGLCIMGPELRNMINIHTKHVKYAYMIIFYSFANGIDVLHVQVL